MKLLGRDRKDCDIPVGPGGAPEPKPPKAKEFGLNVNFLDVLVGPGGEAGPRRRAKQSHGNTQSLLESTDAAGNDMSKHVSLMDTGKTIVCSR